MLFFAVAVALLPWAQALTPKPGDSFGQEYTCDNPDQTITRKNTLLNCPAFTKYQSDCNSWKKYTGLAWSIAFQENCAFQGDFNIGNGKPGLSAEISLFRLNWGMITTYCTGYIGMGADSFPSNGLSLHGSNVCAAADCLIQAYDAITAKNGGDDTQFYAQHRGGVTHVGNSDDGYYKDVITTYFEPWVMGQVTCGSGGSSTEQTGNTQASPVANAQASPVVNSQASSSNNPSTNQGQGYSQGQGSTGGQCTQPGLGCHPGYTKQGDGLWYSNGVGYAEGGDGKLYDKNGSVVYEVTPTTRRSRKKRQNSGCGHLCDAKANWYQMSSQ